MNTTTSPHHVRPAVPAPNRNVPAIVRHCALLSISAAVALAMSGCASQQKFSVEALRSQDPSTIPQQSYRLVDARPGARENDPEFDRVSRDLQTALSSKGLYAAPAGTHPQLVIEVDYGISAPVVTQGVWSEPVYIERPSADAGSLLRGSDRAGQSTGPHLVGQREHPYTITTYVKHLRVTARETETAPDRDAPRQVWSVHVTNKDDSDNLRRYTRLMVAAAMDSIGTDLSKRRSVVLTRRDCRVEFVAQGIASI